MSLQQIEHPFGWYLFLGMLAVFGLQTPGWDHGPVQGTDERVNEVRPLKREWCRQFRHVGVDLRPYTFEGGQQDELAAFVFRYRRSIDLLKSLYEKILALDHHFSSLETHQHILSLSNPLSYPEFEKTREIIQERMQKRFKLELPEMLNSNPYVSTTFAMVGSLLGSGKASERQENLASIACILDFTLKMHADLHVIYFETEYLKDANFNLKERAEELFLNCADVIGYENALEDCREEDDWEDLYQRIDYFEKSLRQQSTEEINREIRDLQFAVNRVVEFTHLYTRFIEQGNKYYRKFERIVDNFDHERQCSDKLPADFTLLKREISQSLEKFTTAYSMRELEGSRLKELLYGE